MDNNKILHISSHLGGGVGRVLTSYLKECKKYSIFSHDLYCLDSINYTNKKILKSNNIYFDDLLHKKHTKILKKIKDYEIIIIHWWNHPLIYEFLVKNELLNCRVIIWSHVSGNNGIQKFTKSLLNYPDQFIFSTPISYLNKLVEKESKVFFNSIWATGGINHVKNIKKKKHKTFNIGYIGTIDFSKMYPNFINMCEKINIPNVKFIICGEGSDLDTLKKQVKDKNLEEKFVFTGFIQNINKYLSIFDIFGYPLNKEHYGTCDQVIAEAMASGLPVVSFRNHMEKYMIHDSYSGIIVNNEKNYIQAIENLYKNTHIRYNLAINAKNDAKKRYNLKSILKEWENVYIKILNTKKSTKKWKMQEKRKDIQPYQLFLESLGKEKDIFKNNDKKEIVKLKSSYEWTSKTKGSIFHYLSFFPKDKKLKEWNYYINGENYDK